MSLFFSTISLSAELNSLLLQANEMHPSLETRAFTRDSIRHVSFDVLQANPQHAHNSKFIKAVARSGSQGQLNGENMLSALYALYHAQEDLGFYGFEASTTQFADQFEATLRKIWAHNVSIGRANVYRNDTVLVVIWHDGVTLDVWNAVNAKVVSVLN